MFCINCGGQNVDATSQKNGEVFIERGEIGEEGRFEEEFEAAVLECSDCEHEMVSISFGGRQRA
jgi:hypothetical protein